jgi:mitochondrial fission protein ELM1
MTIVIRVGMKLILFLMGFLFLTSCAGKNAPLQKSNLTFSKVKNGITKKKTTQAEIIQMLGSPNLITRNRTGEEVWTYSRQSTDSESGGNFFSILIAGSNKAFSTMSSSTFDLIITFDSEDIVKDYSVVQSQF